ncbi:MAG: hypothetical protein IKU28_08150 [Erysipelotrichaceae bacterium]|nr:hypothetical protein [Erysipelotrichaceae bacterium]
MKAKKELSEEIAEGLHSLINILENADNLRDIFKMSIYYLHPLQGKRKGQYALDIAGRRAGYRLIIIPLDPDGNPWKEKDVNIVYKSTQVILAWEVTNHYD